MPALVFDLGGTHLRSAVSDDSASLYNVRKRRITSFVSGIAPQCVWSELVTLMASIAADLGRDLPPSGCPIVVSFPGPIAQDGAICSAPTLLGSTGVIPHLGEELQQLTGREVYLLNDVSAAAWYLSQSLGSQRFLVVTVSSGIGSKLFDPVSGVLDDTHYSGEIGHTRVDQSPDALLCDCGGRGHLGAIASGRGVERTARRRALADPIGFQRSSCAREFGATAETLCNEEHIVPALRAADPWCLSIVRNCADYLAQVLLNCILSAGLERVILIGGFALAGGEDYLRVVRKAVCDACDYSLLKPSVAARIELGVVDEEASLRGAAVYARRVVDASSVAAVRRVAAR